MNPDTHHASLIDAVHAGIRFHPDPEYKADYGSILQRLLARQAKTHAAMRQQPTSGAVGGVGGAQDAGGEGPSLQWALAQAAAHGQPATDDLVYRRPPLTGLESTGHSLQDVMGGFLHNPVPTPYGTASRLAEILAAGGY